MLLLAVARDRLRQGTISRTCRAREFDLLILTVKKMYFGLIPPCPVYSILLTLIHKNHRGTLARFLIETLDLPEQDRMFAYSDAEKCIRLAA
jgi:hypothetical protein